MLTKTLLSTTARRVGSAASLAVRAKHTLPDLPYDYNALEPYVSAQIMQLHHSGHHATYVNTLNGAEEQLAQAVQKGDVKQQISLQKAVNFNGGGHINHSLFWTGLAPENQGGGDIGSGELKKAIERDFGSFDELKKAWTSAALGIQGSGWAWLGADPKSKKLSIVTTANQDPLLSHTPLLGIDMWEHAFYLQHLNKKPPYLDNIMKVLNFKEAEKRLAAA